MTTKKTPSCADSFEADAISVNQARNKIIDEIEPIKGIQKLALRSCLNHFLAQDITSPIHVPSHINSAMDGYAIAGDDLPTETPITYKVIGTAYAGKPSTDICQKGQVIRIMTGGVMPKGCPTFIHHLCLTLWVKILGDFSYNTHNFTLPVFEHRRIFFYEI